MRSIDLFFVGAALMLASCSSRAPKPVDIFAEDACSTCRMAISNVSFAAEIISTESEVFKFDDIGCLESWKEKPGQLEIAAVFYKDYETKLWLGESESIVVRTGVMTPMGSGKLAFSDSTRAKAVLAQYPAE